MCCRAAPGFPRAGSEDRKSTRLNSSHGYISYAVFCLKKKKLHRAQRRRWFCYVTVRVVKLYDSRPVGIQLDRDQFGYSRIDATIIDTIGSGDIEVLVP